MMNFYRLLVFIFFALSASFFIPVNAQVQDAPDEPPAGYLDFCNQYPSLYDRFGPNCVNPVTWNLDGFFEIGTWVYFIDDETGLNDMGLIQGYTWDFATQRYDYYVMTQMPMLDQKFGGRFEDVPLETIISVQQVN